MLIYCSKHGGLSEGKDQRGRESEVGPEGVDRGLISTEKKSPLSYRSAILLSRENANCK